MEVTERSDIYLELEFQDNLSRKREKYFSEEFDESFKGNYFEGLATFLGALKKKDGVSEDLLLSSATLIMSLDSTCPHVHEYEYEVANMVGFYEELLKKEEMVSAEVDGVMDQLLSRYFWKKSRFESKADYDRIVESTSLIKKLTTLLAKEDEEGLACKYLVKLMSGKSVDDRSVGVNMLGYLSGERANRNKADVYAKMFEIMEPDNSLDVVYFMDGGICGDWINKLYPSEQSEYWKSFSVYAKKMTRDGYDCEELFASLYSDRGRLKYELPTDLLELLDGQEKKVSWAKITEASIENIWFDLCGNDNLESIESEVEKITTFENRFRYLKERLPGESEDVCKLLARILTSDISALFQDSDWQGWVMDREIDWADVLKSPSVGKVWEKIKENPVIFAYQMAFWLANFPVKSLEEVGMDRVDLIEGVVLETGTSNLCGSAETNMQQSLNTDNVVIVADGKLLLKKDGKVSALCTKDFAVIDDGIRHIFKRGCYYSPRGTYEFSMTKPMTNLQLEGHWVFERVARGGAKPRAPENLLHLADRWLDKHGYKKN